jgi:hypothetical protein
MTEAFARLDGHTLLSVRLNVPNVGPWYADCELVDAPELTGHVTLQLGARSLVGTVSSTHEGTHTLHRRCRVVAGAGGWGSATAVKHYHNDAGVRARVVADDAARSVGETLGDFTPRADRMGTDYVRQAVPASVALEAAAGGAPWWVDYAGVTQVGPRPAAAVAATVYEVLAYDPITRCVTLAVDDLGAVAIGSILSERLDAPQTVRDLEATVTEEGVRIVAWCGGAESALGRLAGLLRTIGERTAGHKLFGKYRYRVVRMSVDRVDLQAVRRGAGLPDLSPVAMRPGIAGAHAELAGGAEVLVEFLEGDRTMPVISGFGGKGDPGFVPERLTLGGTEGEACARSGDAVEVLLPPAMFSGTIGGLPASGMLTFPLTKTLGIITAGSSKVKVAT